MSTRGLYRLEDGTYVRTQSEIPKGQTPNKVEVPIGSQELCDYLNAIVLEERAKVPLDSHVEQVAFDAPFDQSNLGTGSPETPEEVQVPSPPPAPRLTLQQKREAQKQREFDVFEAIAEADENQIRSIILFAIDVGIEHTARHQKKAADFIDGLRKAHSVQPELEH